MEELKKALSGADDEYLISLSNKGTLKRAYKDLGSAEIKASYIEGSAYITVDGTQCVVLTPLAESSCTCPSRSICRHIVTAILWLKKELLDSAEETETASAATEENGNTLENELSAFPLKDLQKAMKKKYYNAFIEKAKINILPKLEELSVITADIPEDNATVKLISPLAYSACTCRSKELCKHKASAILTWQLKHKIISIDSLVPNEEKKSGIDIAGIHECAEYVMKFLTKLLSDGLVRTSDDMAEQAESAAVMCHNVRLAEGERGLREIGNRLSAYIAHSPEFNSDMLFSLIMDNMQLLQKIRSETDEYKLSELMGEFKSSYTISDTLELIPLAQRNFSSAAGYEGEIYYFVNKDIHSEKKFLTYSDIRPTFYENNRRRAVSNAPWGLYGLTDTIMKYELRLTLPKLNGIKLSSSNDTKAEEICKPNLNQNAVYSKIYTDYLKMLEDIFGGGADTDGERLVLLMSEKCISSKSDEITQTHNIVLEDQFGQRITVKARYKSGSKDFFEQLDKVGEIMLSDPEKHYVIFGNAYIENEKCCIYPIAVFDNITMPETDTETDTEERYPYNSGYDWFAKLFREIQQLLGDIIQCGINSFDLYAQIDECSEECRKSGLIVLSEKLKRLSDLLKAKNHTYSDDNTEIIVILTEIYLYLKTGVQKTEVKLAINHLYQKGDE